MRGSHGSLEGKVKKVLPVPATSHIPSAYNVSEKGLSAEETEAELRVWFHQEDLCVLGEGEVGNHYLPGSRAK